MSTFNPRRFAQVDVLRQLDQDNLLTFLSTYSGYLSGRGFSLASNGNGELDLDKLAEILLQPTEGVDDDLVEALFLLHELSDEDRFEELCKLADAVDVTVKPDSSPADVALAIWLKDPMRLRRSHAEVLVLKPKTYFYFQSEVDAPGDFDLPDENLLADVGSAMDVWFASRKRGTGARVFAFDATDENKVYFLIRHGMPFKREGKIENGKSSAVFYRPEFHDVVIYDRTSNELAIFNKSQAKGERAMYVAVIGDKLFGDDDYFVARHKFTLDPLREIGTSALATTDVEGIDEIRLTELQLQHPGTNGDFRIRRSNDMFAMWDEKNEAFPDDENLHAAKFSVKFTGSRRPRTISITPPAKANYDRNEDAHLIETWLRNRGFAIPKQHDEGGDAHHDGTDVVQLG
jgi:hypothetical protein